MSCDTNEQSPGIALLNGVANGLGGLIGVSGFWNPVDDSGLTDASNDFSNQKSKIQAKLDNMQSNIKKVEQEYWNAQMDYITASNKFHQELEDDKIQENTLLIQIIIAILLIIIIYLVFL